MPGDADVENGPLLEDENFTRLIMAVQEQGDGDKLIPIERRHRVIEETRPYRDIIQYYFDSQYHQIKSSILDPKVHSYVMHGVFLHQQGRLPNPPHPERALIIMPLMVVGSLTAQDNITLEVGRPIYIRENASVELVGTGKLLSIDLVFSK
ncbi:hypothetical protein O988_01242 [Pseudogymnoascus sp. VKM F-3808]|nr:hypothetical protein O988_01242 [Pseudogymnoascus sp. VKM F-3808]